MTEGGGVLRPETSHESRGSGYPSADLPSLSHAGWRGDSAAQRGLKCGVLCYVQERPKNKDIPRTLDGVRAGDLDRSRNEATVSKGAAELPCSALHTESCSARLSVSGRARRDCNIHV